MAYLTIMRAQGDSDAMLAAKRETMDPVVVPLAEKHGAISHAAVRTDDGIMIVNIWESKEGSDAMWNEPDVEAARAKLMDAFGGPPSFEHYELDDFRRVGE